MREPQENGCSFYVWAFTTDSGDMLDFITAAEALDKKIREQWRKEPREGHRYDPDNRKALTKFNPPDSDDDHGSMVVVCCTVRQLQVCLSAMAKAHLYHPTVFATTEGFSTETTANVSLRLGEEGTHASAAAPKDTPPLPGLYAARKLIETEISRLGGSNGY